MKRLYFKPNAEVIKEGDGGNCAYIVEAGCLEVSKVNDPNSAWRNQEPHWMLIEDLIGGTYEIRRRYPDASILVTTGTVTSATMMHARLPHGVIHQFVPIDRQVCVARFLHHWKPDVALWLESDFWPNLLTKANSIIKTPPPTPRKKRLL